MKRLRLLVHESDRTRGDLASSLRGAGFETIAISDRTDLVRRLGQSGYDGIVLDRLFDFRRRGILDWVHERSPERFTYVFTRDPSFVYICDTTFEALAGPHMEQFEQHELTSKIRTLMASASATN